MKLKYLMMMLIMSGAAFAQSDRGGNGGGGVRCVKNGVETVVTLDYYQASLKKMDGTQPKLVSLEGSQQEVIERMLGAIKEINDVELNIRYALDEVDPINEWRSAKLSEFNDHGKAYVLDSDCQYVQLAIRQDDVIYGDPEWIAKLSEGQKALLLIHEALYKKAIEVRNVATSFPVRNAIATWLEVANEIIFDLPFARMHLAQSREKWLAVGMSYHNPSPQNDPESASLFGTTKYGCVDFNSGDHGCPLEAETNKYETNLAKLKSYKPTRMRAAQFLARLPRSKAGLTLSMQGQCTAYPNISECKKGYLSYINQFLNDSVATLELYKNKDEVLKRDTIKIPGLMTVMNQAEIKYALDAIRLIESIKE